jgi:hypothetical protein
MVNTLFDAQSLLYNVFPTTEYRKWTGVANGQVFSCTVHIGLFSIRLFFFCHFPFPIDLRCSNEDTNLLLQRYRTASTAFHTDMVSLLYCVNAHHVSNKVVDFIKIYILCTVLTFYTIRLFSGISWSYVWISRKVTVVTDRYAPKLNFAQQF